MLVFSDKKVYDNIQNNTNYPFILNENLQNVRTMNSVAKIWGEIKLFLSCLNQNENDPDIVNNPIILNAIFAVYYIQNYFFDHQIGNVDVNEYKIYGKDLKSLKFNGTPIYIRHLYRIGVIMYENDDYNIDGYNIVNSEQETIDELVRLMNITSNESCKKIINLEIDKLILENSPNNLFNDIKDMLYFMKSCGKQTKMEY